MKLRSHFILAVACLLLVSTLHADPENFMIENLTFVRPTAWEWIVPDSEVRKAHLRIYNQDKSQNAEAIFYWFPTEDKQGDPDGCVRRWQAQFKDKEKVRATVERSTFGQYKVTYAQMEGVYKGFGKEPATLPDHALLGTVVQNSKGSIMIRMTGPKDLVHGATKRFKKMIEDALKEE
jgi:hypothetical protein